jgi:hypothetical protein
MNKDIKILVPVLRKIMPMTIAASLVNVQPMSSPSGNIFTTGWRTATYKVVAKHEGLLGTMYHIKIYQNPIAAWLEETFEDDIGTIFCDEHGGELYVLPAAVFTMLELKYV